MKAVAQKKGRELDVRVLVYKQPLVNLPESPRLWRTSLYLEEKADDRASDCIQDMGVLDFTSVDELNPGTCARG